MAPKENLDKNDLMILRSFNRKHKQTIQDIKSFTKLDEITILQILDSMEKGGIVLSSNYDSRQVLGNNSVAHNSNHSNHSKLFSLSTSGERILPYLIHIEGREVGNLPIVVCAVVHSDYILLLKRVKRPYIGLIGMIGGKIQVSDSIKEASEREVLEETGVIAKYVRTCAVLHERILENDNYKLGLVIFLTLLQPVNFDKNAVFSSKEGESKWYLRNDVRGSDFIASDAYMISNLLESKVDLLEIIQNEKDGKMGDMTISNF